MERYSPPPSRSALAKARDALDADAEDDGRGRVGVVGHARLDGREAREEREQEVEGLGALVGALDLFVPAEGDDAAPAEVAAHLLDLHADTRVGAHRAQFATGQRVDVDRLAVEGVVDGHDVRLPIDDAGEVRDTPSAQQPVRFFRAQSVNHGRPPFDLFIFYFTY